MIAMRPGSPSAACDAAAARLLAKLSAINRRYKSAVPPCVTFGNLAESHAAAEVGTYPRRLCHQLAEPIMTDKALPPDKLRDALTRIAGWRAAPAQPVACPLCETPGLE